MSLQSDDLSLFSELVAELAGGFEALPPLPHATGTAALRDVLLEVAQRMQDNYPYFHPLYAGQMLKPPHPVARMAYGLAMYLNPNNHALDGGRASSAMEQEAVAGIARMFGWERFVGHLCGGGTMANLEALWVADRLRPGATVLASSQAHYTHGRLSEVLRLDFEALPVDRRARMDLAALERRLHAGGVGTVVATLGTTGVGAIDPLPAIVDLREVYGFRLHVDAAYGGYFKLVDELDAEGRAAFACIDAADSIVVDPHKHGLQPYGCGCVLFRDPAVGSLYRHESPYTYFTSTDLHLGEISLECSRAGASAVALWATQRLLPLARGGEFAQGLTRGRRAATGLFNRLTRDRRFLTAFPPQLDILVWAPAAPTAGQISAAARRLFEAAAAAGLHLALVSLPAELLRDHWPGVDFDTPAVTCLRACLMKPEHADWQEPIWHILDRLAIAV